MSIKDRIQSDMKAAMRMKSKDRLAAIRFIWAAIKQREVDKRVALNDAQVINVLEQMNRQHRESIAQYQKAGRDDLVAKEAFELEIIQAYMPEVLSDAELDNIIDDTIAATGAQSIRDMGKVMRILKEKIQGRADMAVVSSRVKSRLSSS
jgi:uncharacterized protein YqeY